MIENKNKSKCYPYKNMDEHFSQPVYSSSRPGSWVRFMRRDIGCSRPFIRKMQIFFGTTLLGPEKSELEVNLFADRVFDNDYTDPVFSGV